MSIMKPNASITLDGNALSAAEAGLLNARVDLGFNTHDCAELLFWPHSRLANASPGSELSVSLNALTDGSDLTSAVGLGGAAADNVVWTGTVQSIERCPNSLCLNGLASTVALSDSRRSATWQDQSVADIVSDLAGELSSEVEAELTLPNYSVDNHRSVWSYLYELAQLAGAELSCAAGGGVRFILASKESDATDLYFGADLISWRLYQNTVLSPIGAAEHGAASSAGSDKWHWLAHDPVGATGNATHVPAAFRTRDAANAYTDAATARAKRVQLNGEVWLGGRPELRPGSWIALKNLPEGDSGLLRVKAVTHQLNSEVGFITALRVEGGGGGGGTTFQ